MRKADAISASLVKTADKSSDLSSALCVPAWAADGAGPRD